jgi:hypothetical protein
MFWKKKPEPPLRDQLSAARDRVRRQLEIITGPAAGNRSRWGDNSAVIAGLKSELAQIEQALTGLGSSNP